MIPHPLPPKISSRLFGIVDVIFCLAGSLLFLFLIKWVFLMIGGYPIFSIQWWFLGAITLVLVSLFMAGILLPFCKIHISDKEIAYGLIWKRRIPWTSIVEFSYLGLVPAMGFTDRVLFRTESGKVYLVPISNDPLKAYFSRLPKYRKKEQ